MTNPVHSALTGSDLHYPKLTILDEGSSLTDYPTQIDIVGPSLKAKKTTVSGADHITLSGISFPNAIGAYTAGNYLDPWVHGCVIGLVSTQTWVAGRLTAVPIWAALDCSVSGLSLPITTAAASGKHARLGLYACDANGYPHDLIAETASPIAIDATGLIDAAFSANRSLTGGTIYWISMLPEANVELYTILGGYASSFPYRPNTGAAKSSVYRGLNYGDVSAMPDPWGTVADTEANAPRLAAKIA